MISRVNGVNFTGFYGTTYAMGRNGLKLPQGYTWKSYMEFFFPPYRKTSKETIWKSCTPVSNFGEQEEDA